MKVVWISYVGVEGSNGEVGTCRWAWGERRRPWAAECERRNCDVACVEERVEVVAIPLGYELGHPHRRPRHHRHRHRHHPYS